MSLCINWNYKKDFAAGEQARQKFKNKAIEQHNFGNGFICVLDCHGLDLSPRKLLALMDTLGFKALILMEGSKKLSNIFLLKMYLLNKLKYKMELIDFGDYSVIRKWEKKGKHIKKQTDIEDDCVTEIEDNVYKLPRLLSKTIKMPYKSGDLTRLMTYREYIDIKPSDYKNVAFTDEADEVMGGSWYIQEKDLLITTKEDYKRDKLRVRSYSKKDKYPNLTFQLPDCDNIQCRIFEEKSDSPLNGTLSNRINYYCYNLPYEYYSQHKVHFRELFYDSKEKVWKSSSKSEKHLKDLIKDIAQKGFKYPLCFVLAKNGQLIPIGCHTRIMTACFLKLPTIPAVILMIPETYEGDKNVNNIELAKKYLAPRILLL